MPGVKYHQYREGLGQANEQHRIANTSLSQNDAVSVHTTEHPTSTPSTSPLRPHKRYSELPTQQLPQLIFNINVNNTLSPEQMIAFSLIEGSQAHYLFHSPYRIPPINTDSLWELDFHSISMNYRLHYDLNFEHELHLKPNFECPHGRRKSQIARDYWAAVGIELELYGFLLLEDGPLAACRWSKHWTVTFRSHAFRLPTIFAELRQILYGMTPIVDHALIDDVLNVEMIMQQIEHGTFDLLNCVGWLTQLLRAYCAPIRDKWIQRVNRDFEEAAADASVSGITRGLESLFCILEAMKLDMANHYIRECRPFFLHAFIATEQQHARDRIARGRVCPIQARSWLAHAADAAAYSNSPSRKMSHTPSLPHHESPEQNQLHSLTNAVINTLVPIILPPHPHQHFDPSSPTPLATLPAQFKHDRPRLHLIHESIISLLNTRVFIKTFQEFMRAHHHNEDTIAEATATLAARLPALVVADRMGSVDEAWSASISNVGHEMARLALSASRSRSNISARTGGSVTFAPISSTTNTHQESDISPMSSSTNMSLTDLANSLTETLHHDLHHHLTNNDPPSPIFSTEAATLASRLRERCQQLVRRCVHLSALGMSEMFVGVDGVACNAIAGDEGDGSVDSGVEAVARKVAHVLCLHWRIWGDVAYVVEQDDGGHGYWDEQEDGHAVDDGNGPAKGGKEN